MTQTTTAAVNHRTRWSLKHWRVDKFGTVLAFAVLLLYFAISLGSSFASTDNLRLVLVQQAPAIVAALGLTVALASGQLDLSIGSLVGLASVLAAGFTTKSDLPTPVAMLIVVAIGAGVGAINAVLILWLRLESLIATLGTGAICLGATLWYTDGTTIASGFPKGMETFGNGTVAGLERPIVYVVVIGVLVYFLLEHTVAGRNIYATGTNAVAARLAGVRTSRHVFLAMVSAGALAAFAGFLVAARTLSGNPAVGAPYLLPAFAAAFLGAWTLSSGRFHVVGTMLAAVLVALASNGLVLSGLPFYADPIFSGVVLIAAVTFGNLFSRARRH